MCGKQSWKHRTVEAGKGHWRPCSRTHLTYSIQDNWSRLHRAVSRWVLGISIVPTFNIDTRRLSEKPVSVLNHPYNKKEKKVMFRLYLLFFSLFQVLV